MHKPVLLNESIDGLDLADGKTFVDATYGAGGHTREALKRFPNLKAITIDQDPIVGANITGNFRDIDTFLGDVNPDAILLDLGISSDQLESSGKGFSFQKDEPLDMRMGDSGPTAADILNSWDEHAIELILRGFGEERFSKKISSEIVASRKIRPFETTTDLIEAIREVKPKHFRDKIHPATKTFQALRIAVNSELDALENGLQKGFDILAPHGRFVVISFHSLEDRIVKNFFREKVRGGEAIFPNLSTSLKAGKPIIPTDKEVKDNPRSRSAKLRVVEKL